MNVADLTSHSSSFCQRQVRIEITYLKSLQAGQAGQLNYQSDGQSPIDCGRIGQLTLTG
ncbi:MAG: hypothetical protein IBX69_14395 [Anaerolineales bacterium]|nr:hypothetical protein [Anaerolineales bacterium]